MTHINLDGMGHREGSSLSHANAKGWSGGLATIFPFLGLNSLSFV